jgi:hypothetical protein
VTRVFFRLRSICITIGRKGGPQLSPPRPERLCAYCLHVHVQDMSRFGEVCHAAYILTLTWFHPVERSSYFFKSVQIRFPFIINWWGKKFCHYPNQG